MDAAAAISLTSINMADSEVTGKAAWPADGAEPLANNVDAPPSVPNHGMTSRPSYKILDLEIHSLDEMIWGACAKNISLHSYFDAPEYLRVNPHIHHGYRVFLPFGSCIHR